jgi:hypothetical protein
MPPYATSKLLDNSLNTQMNMPKTKNPPGAIAMTTQLGQALDKI